ncbi:hypothetical protein [Citrobacter sedlakii]|uniref:hypothetical protein n=1 Tax=Citrobacter sedlakii TaxID=67826 RepID=UPI00333CF633
MVAGQRLHTAILDPVRSFPHVIVLAATREFVACLLSTSGSVVSSKSLQHRGFNVIDSSILARIEKLERRLQASQLIINALCRRLSDEEKVALMKEMSAQAKKYGDPKISEIAQGIIAG